MNSGGKVTRDAPHKIYWGPGDDNPVTHWRLRLYLLWSCEAVTRVELVLTGVCDRSGLSEDTWERRWWSGATAGWDSLVVSRVTLYSPVRNETFSCKLLYLGPFGHFVGYLCKGGRRGCPRGSCKKHLSGCRPHLVERWDVNWDWNHSISSLIQKNVQIQDRKFPQMQHSSLFPWMQLSETCISSNHSHLTSVY